MPDRLAVVAIGGNSLIEDPSQPDIPHQWDAVRTTAAHIAAMCAAGWRVVLTHGNGPQAGFALRRNELAASEMFTEPMDIIVAGTQGTIGYMLQQALANEFNVRNMDRQVVTLLTQTQVDVGDPAFDTPSKPIGGYLPPEAAEQFRAEGWDVIEDAGRGMRRVVASPPPQQVVELPAIRCLVGAGFVVIAGGGGGVPVGIHKNREYRGAPAVIDKDRTAALIAGALHADLFLISTAVERVALHYNTPQQQWLDHMTPQEALHYQQEGHFARGSMMPKIEAVVSFVTETGGEAIITNPHNILRALEGQAGTHITVDSAGLTGKIEETHGKESQ
ncbi:MAG: carbamate kinase [Anaerolineae bacterium]